MNGEIKYNKETLKDYVKFYNIGSNEYKTIKIKIDNEKLSDFLNENAISRFDFITAAFSLYLSRVDQTKGCLFKTARDDKETLLKIDYIKESQFIDYLNEIESIEDFPDDITFYSINDASDDDLNFDGDALSLNIYDDYLNLTYNDELFLDIYIEHMAANIETLINNILENPNERICDVDILSDWDKELLEDFCYGKYAHFDRDKTLAMAFRENASENPDRIAVDDGVDQVTYGELESSTNSLAYDLNRNYGIEYGDNIALMLPRNYRFIEFALTLNKIGATFIPVDSEYPLKRIEHMMNISESKYLITTREFADLHDYPVDLIFIEDLNRDYDNDFECKGNGEDVFAILFTSGTTGAPKGVTVSNKQVSGVAVSLRMVYKSSPGDISGCYLSFGFGATFRMYFALYFAETVRIYNDKECDDIILLIESIKKQPLNDIILPPDLGVTIYDYDTDFDVKNVILTGTKVNNLPKKDRGIPLFNMYGTSETLMAFIGQLDLNADSAPIGKPIANTWSYILDENKNPVPIGVLGDLYISRDFMSPGYYNRQDLTDKAFMKNPYSTCEDNEMMYHTGDVAFFNFDGEIDILGRSDDQLSVRGFRVESEEIKKIMKEFDSIADIYLDVENDNLSAYYTTTGDVDIEDVKKALESELPPYMIPTLFMEMDELPLNFNAKVDKFALRKMVQEMKKVEADVEIDDEVLKSVVDRFKEVLKVDSVSINDEFVSLGGNSLSAIKLQLQLKEKLDVNFPSNELMELSTPINIANAIKANLNTELNADESNYTFDDIVPLSESQLNVYLDESVNEMGTAYNNGFRIKLGKTYSIEEIKKSIGKLFESFPILKARVINNNDVISFSFDAEVEINEDTEESESFIRPFDLEKSLSRFLIVENDESNILFMDCHHLIFDGTSLNNIFNRLTSILDGKDDDFVDNGILRQISYDESVSSEYMDEASQFYDLMLADRDEAYDLLPSVDGDDESEFYDTITIDNDYFTSFLKSSGITHNQFFSSVFAYTLSRFTGSEKALFKIIEDGRGHIDLSESVGMFVRTLPLLIDCKNQNIDSFLKESARLINSTMKYDLYPFRTLANEYDLSSEIYFQYAHSIFSNTFNHDIVELKHRPFGDFSFFILNSDENSYRIKVVFSDKYSKDMVERFVDTYKLILHEMTEKSKLSDIEYITASDLELLDSNNQTEHHLVYNDIMDAFNDKLERFPENRLVSYNDISYTYAEGAFIADKIAKKLTELGIGPDDCVGFLVERSELYMFCVLGILSMGGVYVPLDDTHPDSRIEFMIKDTSSKVVIVSDETYKRAENLTDSNIILLNINEILTDDCGSISSLPVVYNDIACMLYTSGSTGFPKGVRITRKSILNISQYYEDTYGISDKDIYGLYASIGFDVATFGIFAALYVGACLSVVPADIRLDMTELNDYYINQKITHTVMTTQVAKLFINYIDETSLEVLLTGGEKMGEFEGPDEFTLVDVYGPTESFMFTNTVIVNEKSDYSSVGFINYNVNEYILDNEGRRVPYGAVGELYLSGYQVADGYLNREEENAKAFIENPFDDRKDFHAMYRTGDIVRFLPDGSLGIVGRQDGQVKIRGNRVELPEVENVIREISNIEDVTVQTVKNGTNNELVAYVVLFEDKDDFKDYICDYIAERKPDYMVPSFIIEMDEIPLTVNGKVDKRALPEVDVESLHAEYVAPTNRIEKDIVEAFEKVFGLEKVSIYDDFAQLGGDSLTAIRLLAHLEDYDITSADVLSLHTPYAIAKNLKKQSMDLDIYTLDSGCPLNESQLNVYLDIIAKEKIDSYLIPSYMELSKEYGIDEITHALNEVLIAHPILEMCVSDKFDVPYLIKGSKPSITVESELEDTDLEEFYNRPFDLYDSLSRFLIVENDDSYSLYGVFHHIIFDGLSEVVFKQDLMSILNGESIDIDDSFLKVSAYNQQIKESDEYLEAKKYYESYLADADEAGSMLDSVMADGPGLLIEDLDVDLDLVKSYLDSHGITENVLFTSVFAYSLSRFAGNNKVLFDIAENGRDRFNNYNSIGMYVNTLPIFIDCKNRQTSSFLDDMSNKIYDVMKYNYYPFRLLVKEHNIDSNILFQYLPNWINHRRNLKGLLNVDESDIISNMGDLISDFSVEVIQPPEKYVMRIVYSEKYSHDFVKRFFESYNLILNGILSADELKEINYISSEDIKLLDSYNSTHKDLKYDDVMDAFNDNLSKYPQNPLVSYKDISYTYEEGAFIADKIAKQLVELGITKGDCVSFLTERNEYYILCVLGIMSTGATYVPLDDAHPDERIELMIKDTSSKVIIVSDETYSRASNIADDNVVLLNITELTNGETGRLSQLPIEYGDLACILYTSGTTGVPKGVKVTRKSIVNLVTMYKDRYPIGPDDVYGLFSTIGFDAALLAIMVVLYSGASLSVLPGDIRLNMEKMNEYFMAQNVTHTLITSQVGKIFMEQINKTSLDVLFVGGEKLGEFESPDDYLLVDAFGPTEDTVFICSIQNSEKIDYSSIGPMGYNTKIYILDEELRRVPIGAVGELFVSGIQVADGYLNREEETDKTFLDNPFDDSEDYKILYRSGDMMRMLPDGTLGVVGRLDSQVKIRGNRVELTEVEAVIHELDYVKDVTVQTVKHDNNNELVAYVVLKDDNDTYIDEIRNYISDCKPHYMVPSFIIKMDNIPLNVNGKVDKHALPDVDLRNLRAEYVAPTTKTEKQIVEAFENVFNEEKVSIYDNFTLLGGDSLTAIKILSQLEGCNISAADILSLATPYAISQAVNRNSFKLDIYNLDEGCPLNEAQLNVYLDIIANNKVDSYLIHTFLSITKEYSVEDILSALDIMFDVHPILEMCVSDNYDVPYLVKGSKPSISVKSNVDDNEIIEFLTLPFDLHDSLSRYLIVENEDSYSLFGVFHHMIFDAVSSGVFKNDFNRILKNDIPDMDDSFLKVSAFNQQIQNTEEYDEARIFYDSMLVESEETGNLLESCDGESSGICSSELNIDISEFISRNSINENVLFTSVFAYTLSRFVGKDKVLFNVLENGRSRFNNFGSIGMFVNTVPLILNCENQDITSFISYVSERLYDVMKYDYYPFRLLSKEYDFDSSILFQYLPNWINDGNVEDDPIESFINEIIPKMDDVISDLIVYIFEQNDNYNIIIQYSDMFSSDFIEHFIESYKLILEDIVNVEKLEDINYITSSDLESLDHHNQTEHELRYSNVIEAFNVHLSASPDNTLTISDEINYTYAQSAYLVNEINALIDDADIHSDDKVAVFVDRNHWVLLSALSCISRGITYVPIDENYPDERIAFMIKQSASKAIITTDTFKSRVEEIIKDFEFDLSIMNVSPLAKDVKTSDYVDYKGSNDVACILYTSGTTGTPKAVQMTNLGILNLIEYYVDSTNFTGSDVQGIFASVGFDVSLEQFASVFTGGSVTYVPNDIRLNISKLNEYFIRHNVTHTLITTQIAKLFVKNTPETSLKYLQTAGEKLGAIEPPKDYILSDVYGPTEANYITAIDVDKKIDDSSVGFSNWNTKTYILDKEQRRVPIGAIGELYILGYQTTKGYLDNPEENRKVLYSNPFDESTNGYETMYKTGDLARYLPDGSVGIVGRADSQVKIRGNRVELSEIEITIRNIEYVEDVTVQTITRDGNNELVAYVVLNDNADSDADEKIKNYLLTLKPDYMVPAFVVQMDEIPVNVNGKVDKRALPEVDLDSLRAEYVAPTNENEKLIVDAFEKIFNQEKISILDDFNVLGGDSLTAIKLLSLLGDNNISAADILSLKTPKLIAEYIKGNTFDLDIYALEDGCPLTEAQLNVYLDIIIHNKKDSYILPSAFEISKKYSVDDIINALEVMFEVHPILGMCVSEEYEVPYMVKGSKPSIAVESNASQEFINEFIFKRFDLYDSLSRFLIVENDDNYSLYGIFHHLIFDETSKNVFKFDLMDILDGKSVEREESFLNVSAFNKQIQETQEFRDAKEFYDLMLTDIEQAGTLLESVGEESSTSYSIDFDIDFNDFLSKNNINMNVLFTSVFAYTLSRFVGSEKVLFNLLENGRDRFNNFDSIGMFVNTFPILVDCNDKETSSFMNSMSDLIYKVVRYNYYPFRMLAEEYVLDANILFQFLPNWITHDADDEIPVIDADIDFEDLISDFAFYIQENDDNYTLNVLYSKKYSDEFVKRFAESYISILREINFGSELGEISYISDSDLNILDEYNQTEHDLKYDDILDAFNDNLSKYPENKLVSFKDISYTYKEGAFIADKIAEGLKDHGVDRQDCVAFLVERSDLYMLSVLGIMSLGAVFVPLDDKHPDDRLQYMLSDTQSKAVIISDATYERAKDLVGNNIALLNISDIVNDENKTLSSLPVDYGDLACILYTSGTTGVPKGVKIPRKAIINLAEFYVGKYNLSSEDVFGQYSSIGFDAAFKALFAAIYAGACLDVIPNEVKLDMNALNSHFIKQGINHVDITTPVAKLLIKQIKNLPLDVLFTGGDKLGEITGKINCRFVDGYGPTEAYVEVATIDVKDRIDPSSIGHLIDNIKAYILDNEFRRVPVGAVGELYLAGYQIADGYLNREEETTKAFLENPFDEGMMYRTGDLVRLLPDGSLGIVGRSDSQVKIRGNRVELSEVESVIRGLDYVEDVTVQTIKNGDNNELVAYVVPAAEMDNLNESVCEDVQELKPDYMVPSFVIKLDNIPFNVNGKIDTHALPKVDLESLRGEYVAPTTETEKDIVEAFEKIFNQDKISVHDDFVSLGGNSLTAIKLKSLLNLDINVMTLFKARTPYKIAKIIEGNKLEYGFELVKKGSKNQNMFILPPGGGVSFILLNLVKNIDFEGNVYLIDDFKYDLTLDEIKNIEQNDVLTLNHYYDAIKDIFNDGDIIAGYSLGCIYAALICEKLEKTKTVDKCIFIDMPPKFVNKQDISRKDVVNYLTAYDREEYEGMEDEYSSDFKDKLIEVFYVNYKFDFHTPEIKSHATYLSTSGQFNEDLDNVSDNEYITIDSTHEDIVGKDVYKITRYFK